MDAEARLLRLAADQYQVFTRQQALRCGLSPDEIRSRVERKLWVVLHRGTYTTPAVRVGPDQRAMAALLACGPTSAASFQTAAYILGSVDSFGKPDVSVPVSTMRARPGIVVHRVTEIDATSYRGFRVTTPMRTLLDLASVWPVPRLAKALNDMHRRDLIDIRRFDAYLDGKRGAGELRALVHGCNPDRALGSDGQAVLLEIIRDAGLPLPIPEFEVRTKNGQRYIDLAYPQRQLALEVDGGADHGRVVVFLDDHDRQQDLEDLGWTVEHFTGRQLNNRGKAASRVGVALGLFPIKWRGRG